MSISKTKNEPPKLRHLSLFSGCGGLDLGFEGGFKVMKPAVNKNVKGMANLGEVSRGRKKYNRVL